MRRMWISVSCSFILYFFVTNLVLWLQDFNKLTYLQISVVTVSTT